MGLKNWWYKFRYGQSFFSVSCHNGKMYYVNYESGIVEKRTFVLPIIDVEITGYYDHDKADMKVEINGIR